MSEKFAAPRGVPDYYPPGSAEFRYVRGCLARPAELAGYEYMEMPVFEDKGLFTRGVGESTDVVSKEMYTFQDRGGRSMALRPEGTASVTRAVIEHSLFRGPLPVKLWYAGPFFRAERPQQGRYRQLQQVGIEAIGLDDPAVDAEVIALADHGFRLLGLRRYRLLMTSLGCGECRPAYRVRLAAFLEGLDLDDETRQRARVNPLRVLDDKRQAVKAQLGGVPVMVDHLCGECAAHYDEVRALLRLMGVQWQEAPMMARGLDYYTRTTFEFEHADLGAQSGICGGGRYDGLMASLGGPELSGVGYGVGTDRTLLACREEGVSLGESARVDVFCVPMGEQARRALVELTARLREGGIRTDFAYGRRGLKGAMKSAVRGGARFAVIMGDAEVAGRTAQVKELATAEQTQVPLAGVVEYLTDRLAALVEPAAVMDKERAQ
ncbi:MAG: histidine--tRNA ligase [Candidatus Nanopelagicales bacterium]|nr:histidine--tRNA ligase [Candidatus Nanopelagicales bacterium]MDZ4250750.1 histidine--tRNA ligase [Candidatus Nanopelagicales bacterium]